MNDYLSFDEVVKILKIEIEENPSFLDKYGTLKVRIPSMNKTFNMMYNNDTTETLNKSEYLKRMIIKTFELEKWLNCKIKID